MYGIVLLCVAAMACADVVPVFNRLPGGKIEASIPGFPGVKTVTLTLYGLGREHVAHITNAGADGNWRTSLADVTSGNDDTLTYVIQYKVKDYIHETKGWAGLANSKTGLVAGPVTPRYLQRRATVVFHDDFASGTIDLTKWTHAVTTFGGGINQVNMYTPDPVNSYVKHNSLYIKPTLTVDHFGDDFLKTGHLDVNATWGRANLRTTVAAVWCLGVKSRPSCRPC